jgi:arginine:agmatine antiporter
MSTGTEKIGPALATFLVAGNMIGSGIFLLPATLAGIGGISLLGWATATVAALAIALGFARLAARNPQAGGPCAYAQAAFGRQVGFQAYLLYVIVCWVGNLGVAIAAIGYLATLLPGIDAGWYGTGALVLLIAALTVLNLWGPRRACQFYAISMICGLLPVLLVASFGWLRFDAALFHLSWNPATLRSAPRCRVHCCWCFGPFSDSKAPRSRPPSSTSPSAMSRWLPWVACSSRPWCTSRHRPPSLDCCPSTC